MSNHDTYAFEQLATILQLNIGTPLFTSNWRKKDKDKFQPFFPLRNTHEI